VLGLFVLVVVLYGAAYAFTSDRIPRDMSVAGVAIGGMHPDDAAEVLEEELAPRSERTLTARAEEVSHRIDGASTGLTLDVEGTLAEAGAGRSLNPVRMFEVLTGGGEVDPVLEVDEAALDKAVDRLAAKVDRKPVEGSVEFRKGRAVAVQPKPGRTVDRDAAAEALQRHVLAEEPSFDVEVAEAEPTVKQVEVQRAMREFGRPAMSGPITVKVPGESVQLTPEQIGPALGMTAKNGRLEPRLDVKKLQQSARAPLQELIDEPRPATVVIRNGAPQVVPGEAGTEVDLDELADLLLAALPKHGAGRTVEPEARTAQPDFTAADARKLGIKEVVSEFTTNYPHSDYRNTNLGRAAEKINGTLLKPDEVFSFNDTVGERTAANGFIEGYVISDGVLKRDFGGGVSQVATTTYNAAFFAGLKDIEHHPHSLYFDRYPMGREATVAWGALDLRFQNDTPYGVLIQAWIDPSTPSSSGAMHVRMWSTKYWDITAELSGQYAFTQPQVRYDDSPRCEGQSPARGFSVDVYRHFNRDGERVRTEKDHDVYKSMDEIRCRPAP
jgi:vancomycin resistance protein YoaR